MIGRKSVFVIGNSVLGAAMGYVALFAMARFMGDGLYGARQFALSIVFLVGVVIRMGFPTTHARRLGRGEDVARSVGTYAALKGLLTLVFLALAASLGWLWFGALGRDALDTSTTALALAALVVVVQAARDVAVNTFRGLSMILEREAVLFTNTFVTVGTTVLVAVAYAHGTGRWSPTPGATSTIANWLGVSGPVGFETALAMLMAAYLAGEVAALLTAWTLFLLRKVPVGTPRRDIVAEYVRATMPLMVLASSAILVKRISHVMLGFWWDAETLGEFAAAMKLSDVLLVIANGVTIALLPAVARLDLRGDKEALKVLMVQAERYISLLVWPIVIFVALLAAPVIHILLSDAFLPAVALLPILAFQSLVISLRLPLQTKALGLGRHGFAARVALLMVATDVALNLVLIPTSIGPLRMAGLGGLGAAIAALAAAFVPLVAYRHKAREWTGHPFFSRHLRIHAMAAAAAAFLVWALLAIGPQITRFYDLLWSGALVVVVYAAVLVALRELGREDLRTVRRLLRRET